jgi:hypothetical protein
MPALLSLNLPLAIRKDLLIAMGAKYIDGSLGFCEHQGIEWLFLGEPFYAGSIINSQLI